MLTEMLVKVIWTIDEDVVELYLHIRQVSYTVYHCNNYLTTLLLNIFYRNQTQYCKIKIY